MGPFRLREVRVFSEISGERRPVPESVKVSSTLLKKSFDKII
jgi:hypothetical protein